MVTLVAGVPRRPATRLDPIPGGPRWWPGAARHVAGGPDRWTATDDVRQVLSDAFEQAYPSIRIQLETGPTTPTACSRPDREINSRSPTPDVYEGDVIWPQSFAGPPLRAAVTSEEIPQSFWSSFRDAGRLPGGGAGMVAAMMYQGQHTAFPSTSTRASFTTAGPARPRRLKPPRTWGSSPRTRRSSRRTACRSVRLAGDNYEGLTCNCTSSWQTPSAASRRASARPLARKPAWPQPLTPPVPKAWSTSRLIQRHLADNVGTFQETDATAPSTAAAAFIARLGFLLCERTSAAAR